MKRLSAAHTRWLAVVVASVCVVGGSVMLLLSLSLAASTKAAFSVRRMQLAAASREVDVAHLFATPLTLLPVHIHSLDTYVSTLEISQTILDGMNQVAAQPTATLTDWNFQPLVPMLAAIAEQAGPLDAALAQSPHLVSLLGEDGAHLLTQIAAQLPQYSQVVAQLASGEHRLVIFFQNSNELRPTGGFTGSYADVQLTDGQIKQVRVEDIYQADGQNSTYFTPPAGVAEYLSGGKGWRLPDANWWPDFPTSAQNQIQLLAAGKRDNVDVVLAVNLALLRRILTITGPVYLPDYQESLTASNVEEVLQQRPGTFFAGSRQKEFLLQHTLTQLMQKIASLPWKEKLQIATTIQQSLEQKVIQAYSVDPALQSQFATLGLAGAWPTQTAGLGFFDANVGINKVNQFVTRQTAVDISGQDVTAQINWDNTAQPANVATNSSTFTNYVRLFYPTTWTLTNVSVDSQTLPLPQVYTRTWANQTQVYESGLLLQVQPDSSATLTAHFTAPADQAEITLVSQSGQPSSALILTHDHTAAQTLDWSHDVHIPMSRSQ